MIWAYKLNSVHIKVYGPNPQNGNQSETPGNQTTPPPVNFLPVRKVASLVLINTKTYGELDMDPRNSN